MTVSHATSLKLAWSSEADVVSLVASLEALHNAKSVIYALQASHRFGQGQNAFIAKLPVELINHIEEFVLYEAFEDAKQRTLVLGKAYRCFSAECEPCEHLTESQCQELVKRDIMRDKMMGYDTGCEEKDCFTNGWHEDLLVDGEDVKLGLKYHWRGRHAAARKDWLGAVSGRVTDCQSLISQVSPFVRKRYGLDLLLSHKQGTPWFDHPTHQTVAYLILPGLSSDAYGGTLYNEPCADHGKRDLSSEAACIKEHTSAAPICAPSTPSDEDKAKFMKAAQKLTSEVADIQLQIFGTVGIMVNGYYEW